MFVIGCIISQNFLVLMVGGFVEEIQWTVEGLIFFWERWIEEIKEKYDKLKFEFEF